MFDRLLASAAARERRSAAAFVVASAHAVFVAGAVVGTTTVALSGPTPPPDSLIWVVPSKPRLTPRTDLAPPASVAIDPTTITDVPPATPPWPAADLAPEPWLGAATPGPAAGAGPLWPEPDAVLPAALADEPPELLAGPALEYPPLLRAARVQGRVLVEAVVDTTGRAEPGTIRVVGSAHPGFDPATVSFMRGALFRPARAHGRAVRVLVRVPVEFRLR